MAEHRIVRPADAEPSWTAAPEKFTDLTQIRQVSRALGGSTVSINYLEFAPGARSRPHQHDADQILLYTQGPGLVAVDGGPDILVDAGDFVLLPANVVHMHGAPESGAAAHVSLMPPKHTTEWDAPVPEAWRAHVSETALPEEQLRYTTDARG